MNKLCDHDLFNVTVTWSAQYDEDLRGQQGHCVRAHLFCITLSRQGLNPIKLAYDECQLDDLLLSLPAKLLMEPIVLESSPLFNSSGHGHRQYSFCRPIKRWLGSVGLITG